jgi:hypothetical protein
MFLGIYSAPPSTGSILLLDATWRASGVKFDTNEHGYGSLSAFIRLPLHEAFRLYDRTGMLHVLLTDYGLMVFEGRLEDVSIQAGGIQITAYGYWRAMSDVPYTALWSNSTYDTWRMVNGNDFAAAATSARFEMDLTNAILIMPKKGEGFILNDFGGVGFQIPSNSSKQLVGIQFGYEFKGSANLRLLVQSRDGSWGSASTQFQLTGNAALQTGVINISFTAADSLTIGIVSLGTHTYATDTGVEYLKITELRVTTSITNRINTTLGTTIAAGTRTVTPASMTSIYVGQRLWINQNATGQEIVTVTTITSTTFSAVFANAHNSADTVRALYVPPDEIIKSIVGVVAGINNSQISTATTAIQSQSIDLFDELYEDQLPSDILTYLVGLGDNQTTPRRWEVGVLDNQSLYARYQGYNTQTWYVDITDLQIERTLDTLCNSVYAVYENVNGIAVRTLATSDSASIARYGLTRRMAIDADTTSSIQAGIQQAMVLADKKDPPAKATIEFTKIYDVNGILQPLWMPKAGDTIFIRNLPPDTSTSIDRIRSFRLSRTEYDVDARVLSVEPEEPQDTLAFWLARSEKGIRTGASGSTSSGTVKR